MIKLNELDKEFKNLEDLVLELQKIRPLSEEYLELYVEFLNYQASYAEICEKFEQIMEIMTVHKDDIEDTLDNVLFEIVKKKKVITNEYTQKKEGTYNATIKTS